MPALQASPFEIREASTDETLQDCLAIFNATRSQESFSERFEWLYRKNPDGDAVVWTIRQDETDLTVGFTAALPRRVLVNGIVRTCWIGSDFSVLPRYRTLGLAVKLRRAAKDAIDAGRADFLYAHPNDRMAVIHKRVGHCQVGSMVRLAKPLKTGPYIADLTSSPRLGNLAGVVLDPIRRLTDRAAGSEKRYTVRHETAARFDERFDRLFAEETRNHQGVVVIRDALHLNWRYAENPLYDTHLLTLNEQGRLAGYALYVMDGNTVNVKDVFPMDNGEVSTSLLTALVRTGYQQGWQSISVTTLGTSPLLSRLEELGFRRRAETSSMFAYCRAERPWSDTVTDATQWLLNAGDRDV